MPSVTRESLRGRPVVPIKAEMLATGSSYHRRRRVRLVVGALAGFSLALCATPAGASTLVITGAGNGHGVGMSQEGALGFALRGLAYPEILAHYYTGTVLGQAPAGTQVRVLIGGKVHRIALETYVRGVVSAEIPASWPVAALEAQAVASRTYALTAHAGGSRFDVYADTRSQVFRGAAAETPQTDAAVAATAGQVVTYEGHPAITYFFASSGGETEDVQNAWPGSPPQPWLRGTVDPYDQGPLHSWRLTVSFASAAARLHGLVRGSFQGVEVLRRGFSPRIVSANVLGSAGPTVVSGPTLAARLGLYDSWAYFSVSNQKGTTPEPDRSGRPAESPSSTPAAPASVGKQGGVQAAGPVGASAASFASTGGTVAPD
jgi:stage II sporulation protein D